MHRPPATLGMRHVALNVNDVGACERFYVGLLGMTVEWRPDADNVYLTSGNDNLAPHRAPGVAGGQSQRLDHIGFFVASPGQAQDLGASRDVVDSGRVITLLGADLDRCLNYLCLADF